jgi:hypothetical protein
VLSPDAQSGWSVRNVHAAIIADQRGHHRLPRRCNIRPPSKR